MLLRPEEGFSALESVSVRIYKGSCFGILGLNGSGKSTFLQLILGFYNQPKARLSLMVDYQLFLNSEVDLI